MAGFKHPAVPYQVVFDPWRIRLGLSSATRFWSRPFTYKDLLVLSIEIGNRVNAYF